MERMAAGSAALIEGPMFAHRFLAPADPSGDCLFLLHGSGVDETTLMPLGQRIDQRASLVAARGRIPQEGGGMRWFTRITPTRFEQNSIRHEADAFARFVKDAAVLHRIDLSRTTFLGYSNGANILAATAFARPDLFDALVLMHPLIPFEPEIVGSFAGKRVLVTAGRRDPICPPDLTVRLDAYLRAAKADVTVEWHEGGHELRPNEIAAARTFLPAAPVEGATP